MKALYLVAAVAATAHANPRVLPFTYTTDTLPAGHAELELTTDLVPLVGISPVTSKRTYFLAEAFQTELELGLADRLELALYFTYAPTVSPEDVALAAHLPDGNGLKQRLRYTFAPAGEWPIDVGVYGELAESTHEFEFEAKLLLQKRFGALRVAANLWAELELYFDHQRDIVVHPTLGATYEVTPTFHIGLDTWLRSEYPTNPSPPSRTFGMGPAAYIGPAVMTSFGKVWWTVAAYVRVTDIDHHLQPGEPYGGLWFRTMVGYDL